MSKSIIMEGRKSGSWEKDNTIWGFLNIMLCTIFFPRKNAQKSVVNYTKKSLLLPKTKMEKKSLVFLHWGIS